MKVYGGVAIYSLFHSGSEWSASHPGRFIPGNGPGTHRVRDWLDPRATLDILKGRKTLFPCLESNHDSFVDRIENTQVIFLCILICSSSCRFHNGKLQKMNLLSHNSCLSAHLSVCPSVRTNFYFGELYWCAASGFRRPVSETCALLGFYTALNCSFLPTFRKNLSVSSSRDMQSKKKSRNVCKEMSFCAA